MFTILALVLALAQTAAQPPPPAPTATTYAIDPTTITLIGGMVVTVITALVSGVVTIIVAIKVNHIGNQQTAASSQLVTVARDTESIKGHVNSEKTAAIGREEKLQQENRMLREMLADKTAALQQAQAPPPRPGRSTDPPPAPIPVHVVNEAPLVVTTPSASEPPR